MLIFLAMLYVFGIAFTSAFVDQMSHTSTWQDRVGQIDRVGSDAFQDAAAKISQYICMCSRCRQILDRLLQSLNER